MSKSFSGNTRTQHHCSGQQILFLGRIGLILQMPCPNHKR